MNEAIEYRMAGKMNHPDPRTRRSSSDGRGPGIPALEKRGAGRIPAQSRVELRHQGEQEKVCQAALLNLGRAGFRVRHGDARIKAGTLVAFRHEFAEGVARARWTKPSGRSFESGFGIVDPAP